MEQDITAISTITEKSSITLHPSFSIQECIYLNGKNGVVYSPFIGETLLCEPSVISFLVQLDAEPENSCNQLFKTHPSKASAVIQQLAELHIIEIHN